MTKSIDKRNAHIMALMMEPFLHKTLTEVTPVEEDGQWVLRLGFGIVAGAASVTIFSDTMPGEIPIMIEERE